MSREWIIYAMGFASGACLVLTVVILRAADKMRRELTEYRILRFGHPQGTDNPGP
jgi:hypothetical protein